MSAVKFLLENIPKCPSPAHFVSFAKESLLSAGFVELSEKEKWSNIPEKFFVIRDSKAIIAIKKTDLTSGIFYTGASDFPCFKTKSVPDIQSENFNQVLVSFYGLSKQILWNDRDLSIAGNAVFKDKQDQKLKTKLFQSKSPVGIIPSLCIHFQESGFETKLNTEEHFRPVLGLKSEKSLVNLVSSLVDEDVFAFEANFFDSQPPSLLGFEKEFFSSNRICPQGIALLSLYSLLESPLPKSGMIGICVFDHFFQGSVLRNGASGNFFKNVTELMNLPQSFMVNSKVFGVHAVPGLEIGSGISFCFRSSSHFSTSLSMQSFVNDVAEKKGITIKEFSRPNQANYYASISNHICTQTGMQGCDLTFPILGFNGVRSFCLANDLENTKILFDSFFSKEE